MRATIIHYQAYSVPHKEQPWVFQLKRGNSPGHMADLPPRAIPNFSGELTTVPGRDPPDTIPDDDEKEGSKSPKPEPELEPLSSSSETEILGRGGTSVVRAVRDQALSRDVALKRLHPKGDSSESRRQAFIREARITGQLQHPNIVPIYTLGADEEERPFFTMQIVEGDTLGQWLRSRSHPEDSRERIEKGLEILLKVCDALSYAHSCGVLHRDIKPENIMVGPHGRVYLVDWGIALGPEEREAPGTSGVAGTPGYMSPEQARGEKLDERADIFGLGATLYEILTGRVPYSGATGELLNEAMKGAVVPIRTLIETDLSPKICSIVDKALSADAADRYVTVEAFQEDIRLFLQGGFHLPQRSFSQGQVIVEEGDLGDCAYMIIKGSCQVLQNIAGEIRELRIMTTGELFGELALLLDGPRTATVVALEATTLLVIDRQALETSGALHGWSAALLKVLAHRFRELEQTKRS